MTQCLIKVISRSIKETKKTSLNAVFITLIEWMKYYFTEQQLTRQYLKLLSEIRIFFKKKKRRMRILGARIFSKFFGGKIKFLTRGQVRK